MEIMILETMWPSGVWAVNPDNEMEVWCGGPDPDVGADVYYRPGTEHKAAAAATLMASAPALHAALKEARGMLRHVQLDAPDDDDLQATWDKNLALIDAALSITGGDLG